MKQDNPLPEWEVRKVFQHFPLRHFIVAAKYRSARHHLHHWGLVGQVSACGLNHRLMAGKPLACSGVWTFRTPKSREATALSRDMPPKSTFRSMFHRLMNETLDSGWCRHPCLHPRKMSNLQREALLHVSISFEKRQRPAGVSVSGVWTFSLKGIDKSTITKPATLPFDRLLESFCNYDPFPRACLRPVSKAWTACP